VEIDFKSKRGEVMVIKRKQGKRGGSKKVKMPRVEFDMDAVKEIKKRKKRSQKRR
jgi:hypothetical protein